MLTAQAFASTAALLVLYGCAGTTSDGTLNRAALRASAPRTLVTVEARSPTFSVATSTSGGIIGVATVLFGPIAGAVAAAADSAALNASDGADVAGSRRIEDPARQMTTTLSGRLAQRFSLQVLRPDV